MTKSINNFGRMLFALLLCAGLVVTSCEETNPVDDNKTEQGGNENNGNENEGGENTGGENTGGEENEDKGPATLTLGKVTATTATFAGHLNVSASDLSFSQVTVYYSDAETFNMNAAESVTSTSFDSEQNFTITLTNLKYGTKYNYCMVAEVKSEKTYGEVLNFTTNSLSVDVSVKETPIVSTEPVAEVEGIVNGLSPEDKDVVKVGVAFSSVSEELKTNKSKKVYVSEYASDGSFTIVSETLLPDTKYYYCCFFKHGESYTYFDVKEFQTLDPYSVPADLNMSSATNLSSSVSANCYIVSEPGLYKIKTVKGNSSTSVGSVAIASILWETFGTSTTPEYNDLIKGFCYKDGYIAFQTADPFKEGNAVIAAKDAEGKILWSWHIWLTDRPEEHVYYNDAGTMMDRNLGATSATPGDVGALGLLYQWGRKDPFLGSSSIRDDEIEAKSTITWPTYVSSPWAGSQEYATAHPTTFITSNNGYGDWIYTGAMFYGSIDWETSERTKSIYDPCPVGWRVPDGGRSGVWSKACDASSYFSYHFTGKYDSDNEGMNFTSRFGDDATIWYPASGYRNGSNGILAGVSDYGLYWSASPDGSDVYVLYFDYLSVRDGWVEPSHSSNRSAGRSVRCVRE